MTLEIANASQLELSGVSYGPVSLDIPPGLDWDFYERLVGTLEQIEGAVNWWIGDVANYGIENYGDQYVQAFKVADATDKKIGTVRTYQWVSAQIPVVARATTLSWSHHRAVAGLDTLDERQDWLERADKNRWSFVELRKQIKAAETIPELPLPEGTYDLILADPPWRYDFVKTPNRAIENHYPTVPVEVMAEWDIGSIAADDCVLYLWATPPLLPTALGLVDKWGFTYRTCMVWVKQSVGMGYWARQRHELLLIAVRGTPHTPDQALRPDSVIEADRRKHSQKPDEVYEILEACYPTSTKVELFARQERAGWDRWGLEA